MKQGRDHDEHDAGRTKHGMERGLGSGHHASSSLPSASSFALHCTEIVRERAFQPSVLQ